MTQTYEDLSKHLSSCKDHEKATKLFQALGYETIRPLVLQLDDIPSKSKENIHSAAKIVHIGDCAPFEVIFVRLLDDKFRRTEIRRFLESYYKHRPQGERLFIFAPSDEDPQEILFVSPKRILDTRDPYKVRLWLRMLQVNLERICRTDLDVISHIHAEGIKDPQEIFRLHDEAFSVQRVTQKFFEDYSEVFEKIEDFVFNAHKDLGKAWARDYTHILLNRIMFIYFIARKGWLNGKDGKPDKDFMRNFWQAYKESNQRDAFHEGWLDVLFFEAFNGHFQRRDEYQQRFPKYLLDALSTAPYLNGGLYTRRLGLDDRLHKPIPDELLALLFDKWTDGTYPGLFERYNFTVMESGRFDQEVAVDPEMLGSVYEQLVNQTFEEDEEKKDLRRSAGIFYTPKTEIDLMCRLAVCEYLKKQFDHGYHDLLYRFAFAVSEDEKQEAEKDLIQEGIVEDLSKHLKKIKACDPACGSGSFLVGMLLVLDDLQQRCDRLLGEQDTPYRRRKRILREQIYGVDVMEWAVRVAELRLWLQLVVETELRPPERHLEPLLPNLNLKVRTGDSLIQTIGDMDLSPFRRQELSLTQDLKGRLLRLKGNKRKFFHGEDKNITDAMLKKEEFDLFKAILEHSIIETEKIVEQRRLELEKAPSQTFLPSIPGTEEGGNAKEKIEKEIRELEERLRGLRKTREKLLHETQPPFVWDMAFMEVFEPEQRGFDIVIGNPPYVRQEKIKDYLGRFDREEYIKRLNESLKAIYPSFFQTKKRLSGRADYYVYFYFHALSLLNDNGIFCFITSNSWLDVDFGKDLQDFFLRYGDLRVVIDNRKKRSFAQADINTVIVLSGAPRRKKPLSEQEMRGHKVRFVAFQVPFDMAISPVIFSEIFDDSLYEPIGNISVLRRHEFRAILANNEDLYKEGLLERDVEEGGEENKKKATPMLAGTGSFAYTGGKWGGKYLRAPDIFYTILEKGRGKLVRLGDIAEVRRGFTTGANEFFYLEPTGKEAPKGFVHVRNSAGWEGEIEEEFLKAVIKSAKDSPALLINPANLATRLFSCHLEPARLVGTRALDYIKWGESQNFHMKPSVKGRKRWYDLGHKRPADAIILRRAGERMPVFEANGVVEDCVLFGITRRDTGIDLHAFLGALNCTVTRLLLELATRELTGAQAVMDTNVYVVRDLQVIDLRQLASRSVQALAQAYRNIRLRPCLSIFVEKDREDRRALDDVIFDILGLTSGEREAVYEAVVDLVRTRLEKARSMNP